jgi:ABC-type sugar transport system ATPase subunit
MDSDKIIVMNFGRLQEFGTAWELHNLPLGLFRDMVKSTGIEAEKLRKIAKQKHESLKKMA